AYEALLRGNQALGPMNKGELETALAHLLAAQHAAIPAGERTMQRIALQSCWVYVMRGELETAERLFTEIRFPEGSFEHYRTLGPRGMLLEEQGRTAEALAVYTEGAGVSDHPVALWCVAGAVRTAAALGDAETARAAHVRLREIGDRWGASTWIRRAGD